MGTVPHSHGNEGLSPICVKQVVECNFRILFSGSITLLWEEMKRMNKKEIAEIRKQFTPERCSVTRICACLVDADKNKKMEMAGSFLTLAEEEIHKYLDIFKKTLSGTLGKNLLCLDFPLEAERGGGFQSQLMALRKSALEDDALLEDFYDSMIKHLNYTENYLILVIRAVYDIPGKTSDGLGLDDASDEIYDHLLCSICPVNLSKAGLCYNTQENLIEDRIRDWVVEMPVTGFLFPLFNDRSSDIHGLLYYSRNAEQLQSAMIEEWFGCDAPLSAGTQKDSFNMLVENTLGEECAYDTVLTIHEKLNEIMEADKDEPEPAVLTKSEVRRILEDSGVSGEHLENFDEQYKIAAGTAPALQASNIASPKKMEIKTPDISVLVDPARADLVQTRQIDGRKCLVIPIEGEVEVNGIHITA